MANPFVAGNWKMNTTISEAIKLARELRPALAGIHGVTRVVCPPLVSLAGVSAEFVGSQIGVGAQDCHPGAEGAHTGDINSSMVADAGAKFVILGHSERRQGHGESNELINAKIESAIESGLRIILCCGEPLDTRDAGKAEEYVLAQIKAALTVVEDPAERLTIAYEPIWAIGTGRTATGEDIAAMHGAIRRLLDETYGEEESAKVRILYGGSVKPDNAREILATPDVGGALVGGASLSAESFLGIVVGASEAEDA